MSVYVYVSDSGEKVTEHETADYFREVLNETLEPVQVLGAEYGAGDVLEAVDPIAFRCAEADYFGDWEEVTFDSDEALDNFLEEE